MHHSTSPFPQKRESRDAAFKKPKSMDDQPRGLLKGASRFRGNDESRNAADDITEAR